AAAASAPIAAAQAVIWAPAATMATIATLGAAALQAPATISMAEGITMGLAAFAQGGYTGTGGVNEVAGVVHRGEFVVPAHVVDRVGIGALEGMTRGYQSGGFVGDAGAVPGVTPVHLHLWDKRPHPKDYLSSGEGQHQVVEISRANRVKIGVRT
ncbi:MAG: hypothetical protein KGL39_54010, partial [Patescibacteria group bacterium]|nr:hypothetical protein [Patescibacteria group bacterium]